VGLRGGLVLVYVIGIFGMIDPVEHLQEDIIDNVYHVVRDELTRLQSCDVYPKKTITLQAL